VVQSSVDCVSQAKALLAEDDTEEKASLLSSDGWWADALPVNPDRIGAHEWTSGRTDGSSFSKVIPLP